MRIPVLGLNLSKSSLLLEPVSLTATVADFVEGGGEGVEESMRRRRS